MSDSRQYNRPHSPEMKQRFWRGARELFRPVFWKRSMQVFLRPTPGSPLMKDSTLWSKEGEALTVTKVKASILTTSQKVISQEQIKTFCTLCQGPDDREFACEVCGISLCRLCISIVRYPDRNAVFCPKHAREAIHRYDTWAVASAKKSSSGKSGK